MSNLTTFCYELSNTVFQEFYSIWCVLLEESVYVGSGRKQTSQLSPSVWQPNVEISFLQQAIFSFLQRQTKI